LHNVFARLAIRVSRAIAMALDHTMAAGHAPVSTQLPQLPYRFDVVRESWLHWVLDVIFHEDYARLRTGHGPYNMGVIRHMAMNLLRSVRSGKSLKVRRKLAGWVSHCHWHGGLSS